MTLEEQFALLKRGTIEIVPEEGLKAKLKKSSETGKPLKVKLGLDPTAPDIHLGNAVVLRKMRQFQDLGHEVIIIIGDFTAAIGDPSGRSVTRPQLSEEEIQRNAKTYYDQYCLILDPAKTKVVFNSEWLGKLSFEDAIKIASKLTVARVLERDDFASRLSEGKPIGLHEILYPMCQAYDSVVLESDVEVGGLDQKFNILLGRDLQSQFGQEEQVGLFMPILVGLDGVQKMSKSLGNYVGVTESPKDMFGKLMSIPDELMHDYFELCTDVPLEEIKAIDEGLASGKLHPMEVKKRLAREIVTIYHSAEAAAEAQAEFERVFSQRETPEEMPDIVLSPEDLVDGTIWIVRLLVKAGMAPSNSEARRLVQQGAVTIDGKKITEPSANISPVDGQVVRAGKLRFGRIKLLR
ncbi:MAG: tyrosine--tRNA ligase [Armatimonadota bacterium]|nr:tyrosine--tRNA ligase [Armatimonadota bacterium]